MKPTAEQWAKYEADLKAHKEYMETRKPKEPDAFNYSDVEDFKRAMMNYRSDYARWDFDRVVDAPNKPGYEFANND